MPYPDLYQIESLFAEEELAVRDLVRNFVDERILPGVRQWNREARFPKEIVPRMAELGLLGATIDGYGCAGISYTGYGLIAQELERGDSGFRSFASVQNGLCMYPILNFGTDAQKEKYLPRTNGTVADLAIVFAKLDGKIQGFLVEKGTSGFSAPEILGKWSLRISVTSDLNFDDCRIPAENILPRARGLKAALQCLNQARYSIAWGAIGAAQACFEEALEYAKTRVQFHRPIAGFQLVQAKLAKIWTEIVKAQLLCWQLGKMMDAGKCKPAAISMAKRNNVEMALKTARTCREILGASGIVDDYHVIRHMNNLESVYTYEGTHDIHTLILGQELTGLAAFE
ncbi:MAG: acyl-CoA dehydrogenase family protein [bacterium]|nr:acyl-CoA dehydrogenase family protein [bacterium]